MTSKSNDASATMHASAFSPASTSARAPMEYASSSTTEVRPVAGHHVFQGGDERKDVIVNLDFGSSILGLILRLRSNECNHLALEVQILRHRECLGRIHVRHDVHNTRHFLGSAMLLPVPTNSDVQLRKKFMDNSTCL